MIYTVAIVIYLLGFAAVWKSSKITIKPNDLSLLFAFGWPIILTVYMGIAVALFVAAPFILSVFGLGVVFLGDRR